MLQGLAAARTDGRNMSVDSSPGLADSSSTADALQSSSSRDFGRNLARRLALRRGGLYCVLRCEGHTKHTALVSSSRPAWKQELSFKSVQISADLQVTKSMSHLCQLYGSPRGFCQSAAALQKFEEFI